MMFRRSKAFIVALGISTVIGVSGVSAPAQADVSAPMAEPDTWAAPAEVNREANTNVPEIPWSPMSGETLNSGYGTPQESVPPTAKAPTSNNVVPQPDTLPNTLAESNVGSLPGYGFHDFNLWRGTTAQVNLSTGNLLLSINDTSSAAPGVAPRVDRYYNSKSARTTDSLGNWTFGTGSDIGLNMSRDASGDHADFYGPNGFRAHFTFFTDSGKWSVVPGFDATLSGDPTQSGDLTLTYNRTGEVLKFGTSSEEPETNRWLTSDVDRNGVGLTFGYSGRAYDFALTDAAGRTANFDHDASSSGSVRNATYTDAAGRVWFYTVTNGRLTDVEGGNWLATSYEYDSAGRLTAFTAPMDDEGFGVPKRVQITYDSQNRVHEFSIGTYYGGTFSLTAKTTFTYATAQTTITDARNNNAVYSLDSQGRVVTVTDPLSHSRAQTWTANNAIASSTDALATNTATYSYDALNNATGASLPTGAAASAVYALSADCPNAGPGNTYLPKCTTDPAGNKQLLSYDGSGNLTQVEDTTSGGTGTKPFKYTYENSSGTVCGGYPGQVCTSTDGNNRATSYEYDADGNLITVVPPSPLGATHYGYDSVGRATSVIDGNGKETDYSYNYADDVTVTTFDNGDFQYTTWNADGTLQGQSDPTGQEAYSYNALLEETQRVIQRKQGTTWSTVATLAQSYDPNGSLLTYGDSSGTTTYSYDAANELISVKEPGGVCPSSGNPAANSKCTIFAYDANGAESARIFPAGARVDTTRDGSARATRITAKDAAGVVRVDIGYSYTAPGGSGPTADRSDVQSRTSYAEQGITAGAVTTYGYDSLLRLTSAIEKSGVTTSASWGYTYDAAGNRTQQVRAGNTGAPAGTINYTINSANEISSTSVDTTTWTYDASGNQTRDGITGQTSSYGDRGQTLSVGSTSFTYLGAGNVDRVSSGTVGFIPSVTGVTQQTGPAPLSFVRQQTSSSIAYHGSASHYYVLDNLGSTVGMFSGTGSYDGGYSYSPYGESRATSTSSAVTINPVRYTGQYNDSTGLYKLGARYYDPSLGRFTQFDQSGQESNPFSYATCNPINATDPTGLDALGCGAGILGIIASTVGLAASVVTLILSTAAEIPSAGLATLAGIVGVAGLSASLVGEVLSIGALVTQC
jgi:RHS repeat-associated protein